MAIPQSTPQDDAVNPPKLKPMSALQEDALVKLAFEALGANREMEAVDQQGRTWLFAPDGESGENSLRISVAFDRVELGRNHLSTADLQCDGGPGLVRSTLAILGGQSSLVGGTR